MSSEHPSLKHCSMVGDYRIYTFYSTELDLYLP